MRIFLSLVLASAILTVGPPDTWRLIRVVLETPQHLVEMLEQAKFPRLTK